MKFVRIGQFLFFAALSLALPTSFVSASPGYLNQTRSPVFAASPELRPRINFWIDVFSKYGQHSVVFHHREYPGITFGSMDFSREATRMSPRQLEQHKKSQKRQFETKINEAFRHLSTGSSPRNALEESIVSKMQVVPGGVTKYQRVVREKLVRSQTGIREKFASAIARSGRYMPILEKIFAQFGLPKELTRLPFVESSFDYKAYSSVGAAGIWQFMPRTAKLFGLKITSAIDERRDPVEAGKAAAKYLMFAYNELGTWPLALTSYNHGIYGVKKAVRTMGTTDIGRIVEFHGKRPFGFASNNFYAEFLAALEVFEQHERYFPEVNLEEPLQFDEVRLANSYSIPFISKQLGVSSDSLQPLNYAVSTLAWRGRVPLPRGYNLKVPAGIGSRADRLKMVEPGEIAAEKTASSLYGGATHRVRRGESLDEISRRYGVTTGELQDMNALSSTEIREGQNLIVKRKKVEPPLQGRFYTVRKGDTIGGIAQKFRLSVATIKAYNGLRSNMIKPGLKLKIPQPGVSKTIAAKSISRTESAKPRGRSSYKIRSGDSLWSISRKYGVSVNELKKVNSLGNSSLRAGDTLIIP